jgi:hypothetical protein
MNAQAEHIAKAELYFSIDQWASQATIGVSCFLDLSAAINFFVAKYR